MLLTICALLLALPDEAALRTEFEKGFKAPEPEARVAALSKFHGVAEEKSLKLLAGALKDAVKEVRQAAAMALETVKDSRGVTIAALGKVLNQKDEALEVRLACAKALVKSPLQVEPIRLLLDCMGGIGQKEQQLHKFGADVTGLLDKRVGKSFNADKTTVERWEDWFKDNQERLKAEDAKVRKSAD